jgi:hypothetical protein
MVINEEEAQGALEGERGRRPGGTFEVRSWLGRHRDLPSGGPHASACGFFRGPF